MLTDQPADIALTDLLDALPDAVLWMRTVRNEAHQIVNFRIEYANQKAQAITKGIYTLTPGTMVLGDNGHDRATSEKNFQDLCTILKTSQPQEFSFFNAQANVWFQVNRAKLGDGVLSVTRNISTLKTAEQIGLDESHRAQQRVEQAAAHLQNVIDNSQTGIFVFSPIYDSSGQLIDFRFKTINRMVAALVKQTPEVLTGAVASDWFINYRETGLFDYYRHTAETGEEQRFEINYNVDGFDLWFDVKAIKLGSDVLVTFTDFTPLKQAQQAVERQAGLLNSVLNGSINGIIAFEAVRDEVGSIQDFIFLSSNEAACRLVEKTADELIGARLLTVFPGNKETGLFDKYVQTVETGEPTRTEAYYKHDGLNVWLDISAQKIDDGFVVTFTDVSIIKSASKTVEQSADELRTIIDSAQVAISRLSPVRSEVGKIIDFRYRTANQMLARYVDQESGALIGTPVSQWFPSYLTNGLFNRYVAVFETARTQHFNFHYITPVVDFWINVSVVKLDDDVLVTFSDFTEIKKLQQRLEASTAELQTVIDTSQTGIFLFSPERNQAGEVIDFRFRLANRQLASYVGQEPDAVVGALGSTWFPDYKTNGLFDIYYRTYITGESHRFDFHYDGSGIDVWLDIMATKLGDEVLVTFGDYTPLKQLQQQLHHSVIDLQRSNKNLEQFAYVASHDLQEPLRKIQAFGDIIQAQYAPVIGESGTDMIQRMQSAAARMQVLIRDVLAYSRITTKRESVKPVALDEVLRDVLTDMETAIADKQATVRVEALPSVRGDAAQLRQLFQNLISNALKFTKTDTAAAPPLIGVTTRRVVGREMPEFGLSPATAEQYFHLIEVTDNGIGFDPHQAERIFQVFQRLHGRSEYQGTGIGLAIVQKVVENHQGYIIAQGRPHQGSTFRLLLPV